MSTPRHTLQSKPNTCVAACAALVLTHTGAVTSEATLMGRWGQPRRLGYTTDHLHREGLEHKTWRLLSSLDDRATLRAELRDAPVIALVYTGPMTVFATEHEPPLTSPYGPLCDAETDRAVLMERGCGPPVLHTIVLVALDVGGVWALDPYHSAAGQPFHIDWAWLDDLTADEFWVAR